MPRLGHRQKKVLARAADLVEHGWCRRSFATTKTGIPVGLYGPRAERFCGSGAIMRAASDLNWRGDTSALEEVVAKDITSRLPGPNWITRQSLMSVNDDILKDKRPLVRSLRRLSA